MPLITCSECGGSVSTKAPGCPHCGAPPTEFTSGADGKLADALAGSSPVADNRPWDKPNWWGTPAGFAAFRALQAFSTEHGRAPSLEENDEICQQVAMEEAAAPVAIPAAAEDSPAVTKPSASMPLMEHQESLPLKDRQHQIVGGGCILCGYGAGYIAHKGWKICPGRVNRIVDPVEPAHPQVDAIVSVKQSKLSRGLGLSKETKEMLKFLTIVTALLLISFDWELPNDAPFDFRGLHFPDQGLPQAEQGRGQKYDWTKHNVCQNIFNGLMYVIKGIHVGIWIPLLSLSWLAVLGKAVGEFRES